MIKILVLFMTVIANLAMSQRLEHSLPLTETDTRVQFLVNNTLKQDLPFATRFKINTDTLFQHNGRYSVNIGQLLSPVLKNARNARTIRIYAFTDQSLEGQTGTQISQQQADRILEYLWFMGVPFSIMSAKGMGAADLLFDQDYINSDLRVAYFNRRVEIDIS